jgi:hypothetical protein
VLCFSKRAKTIYNLAKRAREKSIESKKMKALMAKEKQKSREHAVDPEDNENENDIDIVYDVGRWAPQVGSISLVTLNSKGDISNSSLSQISSTAPLVRASQLSVHHVADTT